MNNKTNFKGKYHICKFNESLLLTFTPLSMKKKMHINIKLELIITCTHTYCIYVRAHVYMCACKRKDKHRGHRWCDVIHHHLQRSGKMIISTLCIINNDKASFMGRRYLFARWRQRRLRRVLQWSPRRRVAINFNLSLCCRLKSTRRLWQPSADRRSLGF